MTKLIFLFSIIFANLLAVQPGPKIMMRLTSLPAKIEDSSKINFIENSWAATLKKASAEKKLIFVDAYAVWCAPCRQLKATTFKDKAAAEFFNKNFVNLSLDMEKGDGIKLSEKWGVEEFPTLIILDSSGNVITGNVGFMEAADLIKLGQKALAKSKSSR